MKGLSQQTSSQQIPVSGSMSLEGKQQMQHSSNTLALVREPMEQDTGSATNV
jgi:hypothetical protein